MQHDGWESAIWKNAIWNNEKGGLQKDTESAQQAGQLGCVPPPSYNDSRARKIMGAIDLRQAIKEAPKEVRKGDRQGKIWPPCRWGVACPRLSTDESNTAKAHTPEQARLAESTGVTAAIHAMGGRWWTDGQRRCRKRRWRHSAACRMRVRASLKHGTLQVSNALGAARCFGGFD